MGQITPGNGKQTTGKGPAGGRASADKSYGPQPAVTRYNPDIQVQPYGNHNRYDRGYAVKLPDIEPGLGRNANTWNASLTNQRNESLALWVWEVEMAFQMQGQYAQSRRRRQFFPHNFAQPSIIVRGTAPNNYQYNRLASFVRGSHLWALESENVARAERALGRGVSGRHYPDGTAFPLVTLQVKAGGPQAGRNHRGPNRAMVLDGYIKNIKAGATKDTFAHEYEFEFIVAASRYGGNVGIYEDSIARGSKILPWMDLFKKYQFQDSQKVSTSYNNDLADDIKSILNVLGQIVK